MAIGGFVEGPAAAAAAAGADYGGRVTSFVVLSCIVAGSGGILFGYDLGISGGVTSMESFLRKFFPDVYHQMKGDKDVSNYCRFDSELLTVFTSSLYVAGLVATLFASSVTRRFGRRTSILVGGTVFVLGSVFGGAAVNVYMLLLNRILLGIGLGFTNQSIPLYLSEMAPPQYRGAINNGFELCISIGILIANLINYGVEKITGGWGWRLSLSLAAVPAVFLTVGAIFLPETPSFIIQRGGVAGGNIDEARLLLQRLRGTTRVQKELDDLVSAASEASRTTTTRRPFRNILRSKYRPQLVIALLVPFFNQVTGINVINFYAPVMFRTIGLKESASLMSAVVTRVCATAANVVAMVVVDRFGRRKLFLVGGVQMILSQVMVGAVLAAKFKDHGGMDKEYAYLVLVILCVFVAGFAWSWGPLTYLVPTEICPLEIRSAGQSIVIALIFLVTFLIGQTFLAMLCHLKFGTFFLFGGWVCVMTLFVYFFLPETKQLPMEQMEQMEDSYRESIWRKKGRPREMYPDVSCKDAPVPPEEPLPNCDCGHPAHVGQSRHPDTAARCFYTCYSCSPYFRCFFFQWIDGPDKFNPRILLFYPGIDHCKREVFTRWVPPPPNPPPMTEEEKAVASARRLEDPPKCLCGEQAVINPRNEQEFICPLRHEDHDFPKCRFKEWIYGPKSHWPEPEKNEEVPDWKKKRRSIAPPVMCKCGVEASYGLIPSGLGIGHFYGHMIDYDESTQKCNWESYDDVYKFKDEYKTMVALRKMRGYPASYVTDFVKNHKKKMLRRAQDLRVRNPESIAWKKWYEQKKKDVEEYQARKAEEDARKAAEEAARAEMQGLNDTIDSLCAKIGCTGDWQADMARARYTENRTVKRDAGVGATASRPIVVEEEAEPEEDDDTGRIGELIRLAEELGYPQDEDAYDMGRIAELLRLAEELGPMPEEDVEVEEGQAAYHSHKTPLFDAWGPTDMTEEEAELYSQAADEAEAAYYRRQASQAKAVEASKGKEVVVEDSESEDELLTQWCTQFD